MKNIWRNTITKDLYELPIELKFSNNNDIKASPTFSNPKSYEYNFNLLSPIKSLSKDKGLTSNKDITEKNSQEATTDILIEKQNKNQSGRKDETNIKSTAKFVIKDYTEYILKKRDTLSSDKNNENLDFIQSAKINFRKQVGRVKYYWRGTNFNYPFTYMKIYTVRNHDNSKCSIFSDYADNVDDTVICVEDLSKKKINPTEFFYR